MKYHISPQKSDLLITNGIPNKTSLYHQGWPVVLSTAHLFSARRSPVMCVWHLSRSQGSPTPASTSADMDQYRPNSLYTMSWPQPDPQCIGTITDWRRMALQADIHDGCGWHASWEIDWKVTGMLRMVFQLTGAYPFTRWLLLDWAASDLFLIWIVEKWLRSCRELTFIKQWVLCL